MLTSGTNHDNIQWGQEILSRALRVQWTQRDAPRREPSTVTITKTKKKLHDQPQHRRTSIDNTSPLNSQANEPCPPPFPILRHERDRMLRVDVARIDLCAQRRKGAEKRQVAPHLGDEDERLRAGLPNGVSFWCGGGRARGIVRIGGAGPSLSECVWRI